MLICTKLLMDRASLIGEHNQLHGTTKFIGKRVSALLMATGSIAAAMYQITLAIPCTS